ncbi:MAG: hypothetical protein IJJ23_01630 [Clostridia bacterium]|nr:hypothetical protein [Clostridia bacterium]
MSDKKEVRMGLTEEDIQRREEGLGIAGLFAAMGDSKADPAAIAASEDGRAIAERMSVMRWPETSPESVQFWASYEKGL